LGGSKTNDLKEKRRKTNKFEEKKKEKRRKEGTHP
jgi:hypothetical protein